MQNMNFSFLKTFIFPIYIYPPPCPSLRGTKWAWLFTERSEFNDFNDQRSMIPRINGQWCRWWTGQRSIIGPPEPLPTSPLLTLETIFRLPTSSSKFDSFPNPQNPPNQAQNASKTLPQTLPKRIQNSISSYNARNPKKCNPSIRKPHFWRFQTLENRPKIDAKTPWKSALSWIPSWNPQKYDFWC